MLQVPRTSSACGQRSSASKSRPTVTAPKGDGTRLGLLTTTCLVLLLPTFTQPKSTLSGLSSGAPLGVGLGFAGGLAPVNAGAGWVGPVACANPNPAPATARSAAMPPPTTL